MSQAGTSTLAINTKQAPEFLIDCIKANKVPMLQGSPGVGKSSICEQIAEQFNLLLIDIRLSQCDPCDLLGFPHINKELNKSTYVPMDTFPLKGDKLPLKTPAMPGKEAEYYEGWLLLLDEFNSAPLSVQAAAYKLVLDRKVGQEDLHDKVAMICAGNLSTDKAIVNRMSTAMQSRMIHFVLEIDPDIWLDWARGADVDYRILSFINFQKEKLHSFDPNHNDLTFPCPRTWVFLSDIMKSWEKIPISKLPIVGGTVGEGVAREFLTFCEIFESLPTLSQILNDPKRTPVSDEPAVNFAVSGFLARSATVDNIEKLMDYIERLNVEFQVITLQTVLKRDRKFMEQTCMKKWVSKNAQELM